MAVHKCCTFRLKRKNLLSPTPDACCPLLALRIIQLMTGGPRPRYSALQLLGESGACDSDGDHRKHQSSASPAFVRGIHRWPVNSAHEGPVTWKMVLFWWRHHDIFRSWYLLTYTTCLGLGETTITSTCDRIARGSCLRGACLEVVAFVHSGTHCPQ